jgi:hypothetical protein
LLYSYFESFPLVYGPEGYDFPGGVQYLPFAALLVGEVFSFIGYALWAWYVSLFVVSSLFFLFSLSFASSPLTYVRLPDRNPSSSVLVLMIGTITNVNSKNVEVLSSLKWHYQWVSQELLVYPYVTSSLLTGKIPLLTA